MTPEQDRLEHLFSRFLDDECSPDERTLVRRVLRTDPVARALFMEMRSIDEAVGGALRAVARPQTAAAQAQPHVRHRRPLWRNVVLAAAACIAMAIWMRPALHPAGDQAASIQRGTVAPASWFANGQRPAGDWIMPADPSCERPEVRLRGVRSDWVVIPAEDSGTYFLIEVQSVGTHKLGVHADF